MLAASTVVRTRYCHRCGHPAKPAALADGVRAGTVCGSCGTAHQGRPLNVVGTVCFGGAAGECVLLCRRAIEPRLGFWTLPAGFMELGETVAQGAQRETQEEAGANVELLGLLALIDVLPAGQVHLLFRARMRDTRLLPGPESLDAKLFAEHEVPWDQLAFRTVEQVLRHYFDCRRRGAYPLLADRIG